MCKNEHRFEARYEEQPNPDASKARGAFYMSPEQQRSMAVVKTYVRDVCVKCGAVIERLKP